MVKVKNVTDYMWQLITAITVLSGVIGYMYKQSIEGYREEIRKRDEKIEKLESKCESKDSTIKELYQLIGSKQAIVNLKIKTFYDKN